MIPSVKTTKHTTRSALACVLALGAIAALPLGGCRGDRTDKPPRQFFPDMDDQPKNKAQSETEFFADGQSQRPLVEGVVPFSDHSVLPTEGDSSAWAQLRLEDRANMLREDETFYFGLVSGSTLEEPSWAPRMPVEVTKDLIDLGQEQYNIFCAMCHGYDMIGNESGTVGRLMNVRPVNLLDDKYRDRNGEFGTDGYIYHVIREGLWSPDGSNRMPAYGHAVNEEEGWAIVSYMRVMQAAFDAEGKPTTSSGSASNGGEE